MTAMRNGFRTTDSPRGLRLAACALLLACAGVAAAQMGPLQDLSTYPIDKLTIAVEKGADVKASGGRKQTLEFTVWLADTPPRQTQGLMFVRSLAPARGMLFVHPEPRTISMWMKNTYISLDMVFIDDRGRVQQIVERTTPHSLDLIQSKAPARAVLEIAGGEASRLGIRAGQQVTHPALVNH